MELIDKIKAEIRQKGLNLKSKQAATWINKLVRTTVRITPRRIIQTSKKIFKKPTLGKMYFFFYDAKWKEVLPFWDRFPLCIPIYYYPDGFLGINLHYLPVNLRILLLSNMYAYLNNTKMDESTRIKLTYNLIKKVSKLRYAKPCIKRYLYYHINSPLVEVSADEFEYAILLPVERFVGQNKRTVHRKTRELFK